MSDATQSEAASLVHQLLQGVESVVDAFAFSRLESLEAGREPGGAPAANGAQHLCPSRRQVEADAPTVGRALALDQVRRFEAHEMAGHAGSRDTLALGKLGGSDAWVMLDLREQADLSAGDAERVDLSPQLAREPEQNRTKPVRNRDRIVNYANH
jgi:hypothetical protein